MVICGVCGREFTTYGLNAHKWRAHNPDGNKHQPNKGKVGWQRGLTKETDARVAARNEKLKADYASGRKVAHATLHTDATKASIAVSMRGNNNGKHRGDRQSYYNGIRMDSSWEVKVAAYLDSQGIAWEYGQKVFMISERKSYRPDFVLSCGKIIEVKGYWRKENKEKFELWRSLYPNEVCEVWDKTKLKELKIL